MQSTAAPCLISPMWSAIPRVISSQAKFGQRLRQVETGAWQELLAQHLEERAVDEQRVWERGSSSARSSMQASDDDKDARHMCM